MINNIKKELSNALNKEVSVKINEGRCRKKCTKGIIKKLYNHTFLIEVEGTTLSFSYSDVLIKKIIVN